MFMEEAEEVKTEEATTSTDAATDNVNDNNGDDGGDNSNAKTKGKNNNIILLIVVGVLSLLLIIALVLMFTPLGDGILGRSDTKKVEHSTEKGSKHGVDKEHSNTNEHGQDSDPMLEEIEGSATTREHAEEAKAAAGHGKGEHGEGAAHAGTIFVEIPNIIINIKNRTRRTKFLKMSIYLEVDNESAKTKVLRLKPRIIDQFQLYARNLDQDDLEGAIGLQRLRVELIKRSRRVLSPDKVHNILFREIIIQ